MSFQPVSIDISPLYGFDEAVKKQTIGRLGDAARSGFFQITGHGLDLSGDLERAARRFFNQEEAVKNRLYIGNSLNHRGYVPVSEAGSYSDESADRFYEAFDLAVDLPPDDPDFHRWDLLLGPNVWPPDALFRSVVGDYYNKIRDLSKLLFEAFAVFLELPPHYFAQFRKKSNSQLRLIHYLPGREDRSGKEMGAHTDYECFTILNQSRDGLEVLVDGNWEPVHMDEQVLTIMIGDTLEAWTNGLFVSTLHRVACAQERYSFPYFAAVDFETEIRPLPGLKPVHEDQALMVAGHHMLGQFFRDFPYLRKRRLEQKHWTHIPIPDNNVFEQRRLAGENKTGEETNAIV